MAKITSSILLCGLPCRRQRQLALGQWLSGAAGGTYHFFIFIDDKLTHVRCLRLDNATLLGAAPSVSASAAAQLYPNPARDEATWQGTVLVGAPAAELVLSDVLGRAVRRVAVAGRGPQVSQMLDLHGLAAGTYACRLLVAGQPVGTAQRLTYLP